MPAVVSCLGQQGLRKTKTPNTAPQRGIYDVHPMSPRRHGDAGGTAASQRARFQTVSVAGSWFRQSGVISSRPPVPRRGITLTVRWLLSNLRGLLTRFQLQVLLTKGDSGWLT